MRIPAILISVALSAAAVAAGCSADLTPAEEAQTAETAPERRQKIGKADLNGSCKAGNTLKCGSKGTGNCYCDVACVEYGDCCSNYAELCSDGETETCAEQGGSCLVSTFDVGFPANCETEYGMVTSDGSCPTFNTACCVPTDVCGGIAGLPCPSGKVCIDDPNDSCDPNNGGADCGGICVAEPPPPPAASCNGLCGSAAPGQVCYCDAACTGYGDCCSDYEAQCNSGRTPASGFCVKNSNDSCTTDADCTNGGCGGELCYNPAVGSGISTCECTTPTNVAGCGCVAGKCTWYNNNN